MVSLKERLLKVWNRNPMVFTTLLTIIVLFYPIGLVHELGHYLVGLNSGSSCEVYWWLETHCEPAPQPSWLYFVLGGIFGMIASSFLFISKKVRSNKGIFVGVSTTTLDHVLKAIFETHYHSAYLYNFVFGMLTSSLVILFMFALLVFFTKRTKSKT